MSRTEISSVGIAKRYPPCAPRRLSITFARLKLAEDLLQESLRDVLATGYLGHPERAVALVERELHQTPEPRTCSSA